jgi:hypothetical protein
MKIKVKQNYVSATAAEKCTNYVPNPFFVIWSKMGKK